MERAVQNRACYCFTVRAVNLNPSRGFMAGTNKKVHYPADEYKSLLYLIDEYEFGKCCRQDRTSSMRSR